MFSRFCFFFLHICIADDAPEAEVDEVLDSLRLRIRHMFRWAKSEVKLCCDGQWKDVFVCMFTQGHLEYVKLKKVHRFKVVTLRYLATPTLLPHMVT